MNDEDKPNDLSIKTFLKHFLVESFHIDNRIIKTIYTLLFKPGQLTAAYFNSAWENYIQPLKLYFAINFIFFLATPVLNTSQTQVFNFNMKSIIGSNKTYQRMIDKQIRNSGVSEKIYEERFNAHLKYNQPAFVFFIVPFFALILNIINFRSKQYYVEHLFFSIHFLSFFLISLLVFISSFRALKFVFDFFSISFDLMAIIMIVVLFALFIAYLAVATKRYYGNRIFVSILKSPVFFLGFILTFGGYIQFLFFYTILALKWGY